MQQRYAKRLIPMLTILVGCLLGTSTGAIVPALPAKDDGHTILPGVGLKGCRIGAPLEDARKQFGEPSSDGGSYIHFAAQGVEACVEAGKIRTLFFHYRSRTHKQFRGRTDKGIGKQSTIEEVMKQYGEPDRIGESVVSEFGPEPGAYEHYLPYARLGIAFTFSDRKLAHVRVFEKDQ